MKNFKLLTSLIFLSLFVITSCGGTTAPLVERDNATKEIKLAEQVNAPEYAPSEYQQAEDNFESGQGLIDEKNKTEDNTKAKQHYLDAYASAKVAFEKSATPYLTEYIEETVIIIDEAEENGVDASQIEEARAKNDSAKTALGENRYTEALSLATEARELAESIVPEEIEYIVNEGDTLWSIAKSELGDGLRWIEIYKRNIEKIVNFNLIFPGQEFMIAPKSSEQVDQFSFSELGSESDNYIVGYRTGGQTLSEIAEEELGSSGLWEQIYNLNKDVINDPNLIYPGQELKLRN